MDADKSSCPGVGCSGMGVLGVGEYSMAAIAVKGKE